MFKILFFSGTEYFESTLHDITVPISTNLSISGISKTFSERRLKVISLFVRKI